MQPKTAPWLLTLALFCSVSSMARTSAAAVAVLEAQTAVRTDLTVGWSVSDAGDVNGDGVVDLVAGAPFSNTSGATSGAAYVWFGGSEMSITPDVVLSDAISGSWFGFSVSGLGDVDGDGFDDIGIGAPGENNSGTRRGAVYIYYGSTGFNENAEMRRLTGLVGGERFGWSVSRAGDMDRDGRDDFVVGAPYSDVTGVDAGSAYLVLDETRALDGADNVIWRGPSFGGPLSDIDFENFAPDGIPIQGSGFGWAVADVFDFFDDNRAAVAVGMPGAQGGLGRVQLFRATATAGFPPSTTAASTITTNQSGAHFGWSLSAGGFISSDATPDLIVGAPGANGNTGFVSVFYGSSSFAAAVDAADDGLRRSGVQSGDRFGAAVADAGNPDGEARSDDWLVGTPLRNDNATDDGLVYWYDGTSTSAVELVAENGFDAGYAGDQWGFSVSTLGGDLDGDGRDEFVVGAPYANVRSNSVRGIVGLVTSGPGVVAAPMVRMEASARVDGSWDLRFLVPDASRVDSAELWSVGEGATVLARLGDSLVQDASGFTASLPLTESIAQVELQLERDGSRSSHVFDLPQRTPLGLRLMPAVPNPFNPRTTIRFAVPVGESYTLRLLDLRGREVTILDRGVGSAAEKEFRFEGNDAMGRPLASGNYVVELRGLSRSQTQQISLLR